jgi:DNA mismatch endonuclease Vsr
MTSVATFKRIEGPWPNVPEARRRAMQANKASNTSPELKVRRMLHGMGYRFRLHRRSLPGCPDLVFPGRKAIIQVYGCFWHQHPGCRHAHLPRARRDYWTQKLGRNIERDRENERRLEEAGWRVLVVWECALADRAAVAEQARDFLGPSGAR